MRCRTAHPRTGGARPLEWPCPPAHCLLRPWEVGAWLHPGCADTSPQGSRARAWPFASRRPPVATPCAARASSPYPSGSGCAH
eukprot:scaffold21698_cov122-Isochrysis_galbana.AAC.2